MPRLFHLLLLCALLDAARVFADDALPVAVRTTQDVAALEKALNENQSAVPGDIAALGRQLGDNSWSARETAQTELKKRGIVALPALKRVYRETADYEVRLRIEQIFRDLLPAPTLRAALKTGQLGVELPSEIEPGGLPGVRVSRVMPGSAAEQAGIQTGDLVTGINEWNFQPDSSTEEFRFRIRAAGKGSVVKLRWLRDGQAMEANVTLDARDETSPLPYYEDPALFENWYWDFWFNSRVREVPTAGTKGS